MQRSILKQSSRANMYTTSDSQNINHSVASRGDSAKPSATEEAGTSTSATKELLPLSLKDYFQSPLETLLETIDDPSYVHLSIHDHIEAYANFSTKIRSQARFFLAAGSHELPALSLIRKHCNELYICLLRDIRLALVDPLADYDELLESSCDSFDFPKEDVLQRSRDIIMITHHALRLLLDLFTFPSLYGIFSELDLKSLMHEVLSLSLSSNLPSYSADKTRTILSSILLSNLLPLKVLASEQSNIVSVLKGRIEYGSGQDKLEALKTTHALLKRASQELLFPFMRLFSPTLAQLSSESIDCRFQAAYTVCGFAYEKLKPGQSASARTSEILANLTRSHIEFHTTKIRPIPPGRLTDLLGSAIAEDPCWNGKGLLWASVVLSCQIVFSDHFLFSHPRSLKLLITALARIKALKRKRPDLLHTAIWKVFVWAFSRLVKQTGGANEGVSDSAKALEERAFLVVRQEIKNGIGITIVAALLGADDPDADPNHTAVQVSESLKIAKDLVVSQRSNGCREGLSLLNRFVSTIGSPTGFSTSMDNGTPHFNMKLIDGAMLGLRSTEDLGDDVLSEETPALSRVRCFSEAEILVHWDDILHVWECATEKSLKLTDYSLHNNLIAVWQALLLVHAQLTQEENQHLTASSDFARRAALTISKFIKQNEEPDAQTHNLILMNKLWGVVRNVFTESFLPSPAEIVIAALLERKFILTNDEVKLPWVQLCTELVSVGIPTVLHIVSTRSETQQDINAMRQLWFLLSEYHLRSKESREELMALLVIPVGSWDLTNAEIEMWKAIFKRTISLSSTGNSEVIKNLLLHTKWKRLNGLNSTSEILETLLSHLNLSIFPIFPMELFATVNNALCSLYPEDREMSLKILQHMKEIISSVPHSLILPVLTAVQDGLCCWIRDEKDILKSDHNYVLRTVYCNSLDVLSKLQPSVDILEALETFLISSFIRVPKPALGPVAFEDFWRNHYHQRIPIESCPPEILACLTAWGDIRDNSLCEGMVTDPMTQNTAGSIVCDSQSTADPAESGQRSPVLIPFTSSSRSSIPRPTSRAMPGSPSFSSRTKRPGRSQSLQSPKRRRTGSGGKADTPDFDNIGAVQEKRETKPNLTVPEQLLSPVSDKSGQAMHMPTTHQSLEPVSPEITHDGQPLVFSRCSTPSSDDYRTWDAGADMKDISELQVHESEADEFHAEFEGDRDVEDTANLLPPSLLAPPRLRDRSQTAPVASSRLRRS